MTFFCSEVLQEKIQYTKNLVSNSSDNPFASKQSFEIWSVDNCAEVYSANTALSNGDSWDNLLILNILRMVNGHHHVKIVKLLLKMSICQINEINVHE